MSKDFDVESLKNKIIKLKEIINSQKKDEINNFVNDNFIGVNLEGNSSITDYRIMSIIKEWKDMFSYSPGLKEGINIIILLLDKIIITPEIKILEIYKSKEWKELINLRGPVEAIIEKQCKNCNNYFYSMGVSGFLDAEGLVCNKCGDVYFKSIYDDSELPECECGGQYKHECPYCGCESAITIGDKSPYWYFSNHRFKMRYH